MAKENNDQNPTLATSPARKHLSDMINAHAAAIDLARETTTGLVRVDDLVSEFKAELAQIGDPHHAATLAMASAMKAGLSHVIPAKIAAQKAAHADALHRMQAAKEAQTLLADEKAERENAVHVAARRIDQALHTVMVEDANEHVAEIEQLEHRLAALRMHNHVTIAVVGAHNANWPKFRVPFPDAVSRIRDQPRQLDANTIWHEADRLHGSAWVAWREALKTNAEAPAPSVGSATIQRYVTPQQPTA